MKNINLRGLDEDLKRGLDYNRKHGGVSDKLKRTIKRPKGDYEEKARFNEDLDAYEEGWERVFGHLNKKNVQGKKLRQNISRQEEGD